MFCGTQFEKHCTERYKQSPAMRQSTLRYELRPITPNPVILNGRHIARDLKCSMTAEIMISLWDMTPSILADISNVLEKTIASVKNVNYYGGRCFV
jgi:hypothetical protein